MRCNFKDVYKQAILCALFLVIGLPVSLQAQKNDLILKAQELLYSNPDEAIKIGEHILKIAPTASHKHIPNLLIAKCFLIKGDYEKAVSYVFSEDNILENIPIETRIEINLVKAEVLRKLYLDKQSNNYLNSARKLVNTLPDKKIQERLQNQIAIEEIQMLLARRKNNEAIQIIQQTENRFQTFLNTNKSELRDLYLAKERVFSKLTQFDSAVVYMNKSLALLDSTMPNNLYKKAEIYKELGDLYLQQKAFKDSEETLFIALKFAEIINNPILLMQINRDLAINYLATNQKNQHKVYNDEFLVLNNQVELNEQNAINTVFNLLSKHEENQIAEVEHKYENYIYILLACGLLVFVIGLLIVLKSEGRKKRLKEIINYLEVSRTNFIKSKPSKNTKSKRITIPEETENNILNKLKRFETSQKFLNKDMSLAVLAGKFETNTKYLSEIINKHYNDNFNTFINKLRINYIIEKLKSDPNYMNYKISFLAEESGFSSHSSFATVFKAIIGMSPATFINLLKTEREEIKKQIDT